MKLKLNVMRWIASLVGVQMLCGIVWVLGPLLAPLESQAARLIVLVGVLLLWAAGNLLLDWRRSRQDTELAQGVVGAASEEAAAVGAKLATALAQLRAVKGHRDYRPARVG